MQTSRFTTEQIVAILQHHAAGGSAADLIRRHGISRPTFYHSQKRYGDLQAACRMLGIERTVLHYVPQRPVPDAVLCGERRTLAATYALGVPRMNWTRQRDGCRMNLKRAERL